MFLSTLNFTYQSFFFFFFWTLTFDLLHYFVPRIMKPLQYFPCGIYYLHMWPLWAAIISQCLSLVILQGSNGLLMRLAVSNANARLKGRDGLVALICNEDIWTLCIHICTGCMIHNSQWWKSKPTLGAQENWPQRSYEHLYRTMPNHKGERAHIPIPSG